MVAVMPAFHQSRNTVKAGNTRKHFKDGLKIWIKEHDKDCTENNRYCALKKCVKRLSLMLSVLTTKKGRDTKLLEAMDMFITLIMVMVTWKYTYVHTHQIVYICIHTNCIHYVHFFVFQLYLNKTGGKNVYWQLNKQTKKLPNTWLHGDSEGKTMAIYIFYYGLIL